MSVYKYCTRCKGLLAFTQESEVRGHMDVGVCSLCGWRTPVINEHRIGLDRCKVDAEHSVIVVFDKDNFPIIQEMLLHAQDEGKSLADDIVSIIQYYKDFLC
jgi:hypothetical protein